MIKENLNYYNELEKHYESIWAEKYAEIKWQKGPYSLLPSGFHISCYEVDKTTNVMITSGLSLYPKDEKIELFLYFKPNLYYETRLAELLTIASHFHCTQETLSVGHVFNWGESVIYKSPLKRGFLSWPYIEDKKIESFNQVKILWLIPITDSEYKFVIRNGIESLEKLFEEKELNYIDLQRKSLC